MLGNDSLVFPAHLYCGAQLRRSSCCCRPECFDVDCLDPIDTPAFSLNSYWLAQLEWPCGKWFLLSAGLNFHS